jgi:hypothetical protein
MRSSAGRDLSSMDDGGTYKEEWPIGRERCNRIGRLLTTLGTDETI